MLLYVIINQLYAFTHILTVISLHVVYIKTFYNAKVITFCLHNFTDFMVTPCINNTEPSFITN